MVPGNRIASSKPMSYNKPCSLSIFIY